MIEKYSPIFIQKFKIRFRVRFIAQMIDLDAQIVSNIYSFDSLYLSINFEK